MTAPLRRRLVPQGPRVINGDELRATAAMIQARWPGRWEGNLALRLEELARRIEAGDDARIVLAPDE